MEQLSEFQSAEDAEEFGEDYDPPYPAVNVMIEVFDKIAVAFFTLEYIIRFACCPRKLKFFFRLLQTSPLRAFSTVFSLSLMNFIDFMAVLPVFLTLVLEGLEDMRVRLRRLEIK